LRSLLYDYQFTANRQNAKKSIGPKTAIGKAHTAKNALRHGVYTAIPVIPAFERRIDWETHRDGIFKSLTPIGTLEEVLAARVAFCCWRLARLQQYETAMTIVRLEDVDARLQPIDASVLPTCEPEDDIWEEALDETQNMYDAPEPLLQRAVKHLKQQQDTLKTWAGTFQLLVDLQTLPDNVQVHGDDVYGVWQDCLDAFEEDDDVPDVEGTDFLTQVGVPEEYLDDAYNWDCWTASMVHRGLTLLATAGGMTPAYLLAKALRSRRSIQETTQSEVKRVVPVSTRDM
jgi:hypothetical protein